jgi:hypothetical protein
MKCRGYTYDYAERTDMYFSKSGTQVHAAVRLLRGDALEHLRNTFPDGRIPDQEAIVIEYFEQPIPGV